MLCSCTVAYIPAEARRQPPRLMMCWSWPSPNRGSTQQMWSALRMSGSTEPAQKLKQTAVINARASSTNVCIYAIQSVSACKHKHHQESLLPMVCYIRTYVHTSLVYTEIASHRHMHAPLDSLQRECRKLKWAWHRTGTRSPNIMYQIRRTKPSLSRAAPST